MNIFKILMIACCTFSLVACEPKKMQTQELEKSESLGKYVYMTDNGVLHSTRDCINIRYSKDENGHKVYGMEFMDTAIFAPEYKFTYCTRCFTERQYEQLEKIIGRNAQCVYDSVASDEY